MNLFDKAGSSIIDHILIKDPKTNQNIVNQRGIDYEEAKIHKSKFSGHVLIKDKNTNEILVDKSNAINFENMSVAIAEALASNPEGVIQSMVFGSGGTTVSGTGVITYFPPNVNGANAQLYNQTYSKVVSNSAANLDPANNNIQISHVTGNNFTDLIITCTLGFDEPAGQQAFDNATVVGVSTGAGEFVFDELGLRAFNLVPNDGLLLTHVIFSPIQKSLNREIVIQYTLRILLS